MLQLSNPKDVPYGWSQLTRKTVILGRAFHLLTVSRPTKRFAKDACCMICRDHKNGPGCKPRASWRFWYAVHARIGD